MHLTKLFDFFAGTETGAYLATSLVMPSADDPKTPAQGAAAAVKFYEKNMALYHDNNLSRFAKITVMVILVALQTWLAYWLINKYWLDRTYEK